MIFRILRLVLCIAGVYVALAAGCEYRSFRGGHRYIRAFRAKPCISIFLPCCNVKRIFMEQIWEN